MLDKLIRLVKRIDEDVTALKSSPPPIDGISPDPEVIAAKAAALVPKPKDGVSPSPEEVAALVKVPDPIPGKDGTSPDPEVIAAKAAALISFDAIAAKAATFIPRPRDGISPDPRQVAAMAADLIPIPKDGKSVNPEEVAALVKVPDPIPGDKGPAGKRGNPGKPGASVTDVKLEDGKLLVAIDGKFKKAGELPKMARGRSGAGGGALTRPRTDSLGWDGNYAPGKSVPELTAVYDDGWTMVSNKATSDRAAPQPTGPREEIFNGTLIDEQNTVKQIIFGVRLEVQAAGYITRYSVDTVAGNDYQVFRVDNPTSPEPVFTELRSFTATDTGWQDFNVNAILLVPGTTFDLSVLVQEPDPTPTEFSGSWDYVKPAGGGGTTQPPAAGEIVQPNNLTSVLRVSKTDDLGGDRSAELATLTVGDTVSAQDVRWAIQSITDDGTYYTYQVSPAVQAQNAGVFVFTFETVTATPITIGRDAGYWDSIAATNIRGVYGADVPYSAATISGDALGVNLLVQAASISPDWDLMASSSGGGGTSPTGTLHTNVGTFDTTANQDPTGLGDAGKIVAHYGAGGITSDGAFEVVASTDPTRAGFIDVLPPALGEYKIIVSFRIGRTGGAGVARPMLRFMVTPDGDPVNGVQVGDTFGVEIDDGDTIWREVFDIDFTPTVGSSIFIEVARDASGSDFGGLLAYQPSGDLAAWNQIATARVQLIKVSLV